MLFRSEGRFFIHRVLWMSDELRNFLRALDRLHIWDFETKILRSRAGGSAPRERVEANPIRSELGNPAKGLWRNCYNPDWLATLKPHEYRALRIIEEDYDFTLTLPMSMNSTPAHQPEFVQGSSRG